VVLSVMGCREGDHAVARDLSRRRSSSPGPVGHPSVDDGQAADLSWPDLVHFQARPRDEVLQAGAPESAPATLRSTYTIVSSAHMSSMFFRMSTSHPPGTDSRQLPGRTVARPAGHRGPPRMRVAPQQRAQQVAPRRSTMSAMASEVYPLTWLIARLKTV
jgi:hypothetical protein